jgi:hypothetical protein
MDGNRATVRATILNREKNGVEDYPIGAAISDIVDYYNAGTLVRAFTELQKDTAIQTKQSERDVLVLKGVRTTPEATPAARNLSVAASDIVQDLFTKVRDANTSDAATKQLQDIVAALEADSAILPILKKANISSQDSDGIALQARLVEIRRSLALVGNNELLNKINQAIVDSVNR